MLLMEAIQVQAVAVAAVVVDSVKPDSINSICNQLMKYLDSSLEEKILLQASLMMTMISSVDKDSAKEDSAECKE